MACGDQVALDRTPHRLVRVTVRVLTLKQIHIVLRWYIPHTLSPAARKALHSHSWPGNVRELHNTITRAAIRAESSEKISKAHIESALFPLPGNTEAILDRPIGGGFDVHRVLDEVKRHYLARAREKTKTKTEAAQLLNLNNPTTLTNWLEKLNMDW